MTLCATMATYGYDELDVTHHIEYENIKTKIFNLHADSHVRMLIKKYQLCRSDNEVLHGHS